MGSAVLDSLFRNLFDHGSNFQAKHPQQRHDFSRIAWYCRYMHPYKDVLGSLLRHALSPVQQALFCVALFYLTHSLQCILFGFTCSILRHAHFFVTCSVLRLAHFCITCSLLLHAPSIFACFTLAWTWNRDSAIDKHGCTARHVRHVTWRANIRTVS